MDTSRPICTTVTENAQITLVKGGLFRKAGFRLDAPMKEQWVRHAEEWEHLYVSEDSIVQ